MGTFLSPELLHHAAWKVITNVLQKHTASTFRAEINQIVEVANYENVMRGYAEKECWITATDGGGGGFPLPVVLKLNLCYPPFALPHC